jgi:hypothetical protein
MVLFQYFLSTHKNPEAIEMRRKFFEMNISTRNNR